MVKGVLLSDMLERLRIPLDQYFQITSERDRVRHIRKCRRCSSLKECVHMLLGEDRNPATFCPNCKDIRRLISNGLTG